MWEGGLRYSGLKGLGSMFIIGLTVLNSVVVQILTWRFMGTVDQFNKKRVLLPQTLDISYSGVHGNKKFPTVEGPEIVR